MNCPKQPKQDVWCCVGPVSVCPGNAFMPKRHEINMMRSTDATNDVAVYCTEQFATR